MIDVLVTGDDLPALAAGLDLAEVGLRVRLERRGQALPTDARLDHDGALSELMERLVEPIVEGGHRNDDVAKTAEPPRRLLLRGASDDWLPAPEPSVQGVPVAPLAGECFALLGSARTMRAYLDRVKPLLTVGKTREYGPLVRTRLGAAAERVLVEPLIRERFGRPADDVEAALVAPGLNEALSRTGNLTGAALAYLERNVARETRVRPRGGWEGVREALLERLANYGAEIVDGPAPRIRFADPRWLVEGHEETFEVAAVVASAGSRDGECSAMLPGELLSAAMRLHVDIEAREAAGSDWPGAERLAKHDALGLLNLDGETWTVRASAAADGRRRFTVAGPALEHPLDAEATARIVDRLPRELGLSDGLPGAGESLDGAVAAGALGSASGSSRPRVSAEWRAAPFADRREREAARARIAANRRDRETFVPVGARLHGDDLSAAVRSARDEAVALRRLLLGLAD